MTRGLISTRTANYARGAAVYACPPPSRHARDARIDDFASHVTLLTRSPSVFEPRACLDGELPPVRAEIERLDWNSGLWHVFDDKGFHKESITAETMNERYRGCPLDPFLFAPTGAPMVEVEARLEGYEGFFVAKDLRIEDPIAFFRGTIRLDESGRPRLPADAPLFVQAVPLLRSGDAPWARHHGFHLELMWRLLRSTVAAEGAWADMKVTADLLDYPNHIRVIDEHASAMASAFTSAVIAIMEIKTGGGTKPALVPPRPSWSHQQ